MIQLIDCFRLRMHDEYMYEEEIPTAREGTSSIWFTRFLDLAESRKGILPQWRDKEKRENCEELAHEDGMININRPVDLEELRKQHSLPLELVLLRTIGQKIYGRDWL